MTEAEWLACDDPGTMLVSLREHASERKLRLFACGCARRIWHLLTHDESKKDVQLAEDFAEGRIGLDALKRRESSNEFGAQWGEAWDGPAWLAPNGSAWLVRADQLGRMIARQTLDLNAIAQAASETLAWERAAPLMAKHDDSFWTASVEEIVAREKRCLCELLRCIFRKPLRYFTINPPWRTHAVHRIAAAIYDDRAFDRLPILADALEDAGCTSRDILDHCRGPGPHVRGCWVVDLVLGKE